MSNDVPLPNNETIDQVRESRIYARDTATGNYVPLEIVDGELQVAATIDDGSVDVTSLPEPLDVSGATIEADVTDQTGRNLGKARLMDSDEVLVDPLDAETMQPITDTTSTLGSANAAHLDLGAHRKVADVFADVSGVATVTIEVSTDTTAWRTLHAESFETADAEMLQLETAYRHIRAHADSNLNTIELSAKGD